MDPVLGREVVEPQQLLDVVGAGADGSLSAMACHSSRDTTLGILMTSSSLDRMGAGAFSRM